MSKNIPGALMLIDDEMSEYLRLSGVDPTIEDVATAANQLLQESIAISRLLHKATGLTFRVAKQPTMIDPQTIALNFTAPEASFSIRLEYKPVDQSFKLNAALYESTGCFGQPIIRNKIALRSVSAEMLEDIKGLIRPMFPAAKIDLKESEKRHVSLLSEATKAQGKLIKKK